MLIELNEKQLELMPFIALQQLMQEHPNKELVNTIHRHFLKSRRAKRYTAGAWEWMTLNAAAACA
jgi:hypothetical protein